MELAQPSIEVAQLTSNKPSVLMSRLEFTRYGYTFYKDEPGMRPTIKLSNIPCEWFTHGVLNVCISLALKPDENSPSGWKTATKALKLYNTVDRRFNNERKQNQPIVKGFESFVQIQRKYNETNQYEIPLCKGMELSRKYQKGSELAPEFLIIVYNPKTKQSIASDPKFVVMSKRQPAKIKEMRDPNAPGASRNGAKRMKRSEQVKALVSSNKSLVEQYQKQKQHIQNIERQNNSMVNLLKQLNQMAELGEQTQSKDVLACFRICLHATNQMHWMKESTTSSHKRKVSNSETEKVTRRRL